MIRQMLRRGLSIRGSIIAAILCSACGALEPLVGQEETDRPIDRVGRAIGASPVFEPIDAPMRIYYFRPSAPRAVQLIAAPEGSPEGSRPDVLVGVGFFDGRCIHEIEPGERLGDAAEYESLLPAWTVPSRESRRRELVDPVLAFEPGACPAGVYPRDVGEGIDGETLERATRPIASQLEDSLGNALEMHGMKGGTWILNDSTRETWTQVLFTEEGGAAWQGGYNVIVGIRHGHGQPELLHWHGPAPGYASVPFALVDIDGDEIPEVFSSFGIPDEGLYEFHGVVLIDSDDRASYDVTHLVSGWRVDMH